MKHRNYLYPQNQARYSHNCRQPCDAYCTILATVCRGPANQYSFFFRSVKLTGITHAIFVKINSFFFSISGMLVFHRRIWSLVGYDTMATKIYVIGQNRKALLFLFASLANLDGSEAIGWRMISTGNSLCYEFFWWSFCARFRSSTCPTSSQGSCIG